MFSRFAASAVLFALLAVAQAHEGIDNSGQIGGQRDGISAPSGGTSYFVNSISGLDTNNGRTPATAWQSITHVLAQVYKANDSVLFTGSQTITGSLALTTTTNPSGRFTIGSYGTGQATINSGAASCVSWTNLPGITVSNIACSASSGSSDGITGTNNLSSQLSGFTVSNVTVTGYGGSCISPIAGTNNQGFNGISITGSTLNGCTKNAPANAIGINISEGSKTIYGHSNVTITGNIIENNAGTAGQFSGSGIFLNGVNGYYVANNIVHDNGANNTLSAGPVGIITALAENGTVEKNEVYNQGSASGTDGDGIDFDWSTSNSIMQFNYVHNNAGAGLQVYQFSNSGNPAWTNNQVRFNISQYNTLGGIAVGMPSSAMTSCYIYNNSVYQNVSSVADVNQINSGGTSTCTFANNIFYSLSATGGKYINNSAASSWVFNNNDYHGNGTFVWNGTGYGTVALWQAGSSQDAAASTTEPRLIVYGGGGTIGGYVPASLVDYQLQAGSPMLSAGVNIATTYSISIPSTDYFGAALSASAMPIGAGQQVNWTSGTGTCSQATTFLGRTSSPPTATQQQYNALICGSVADGNYSFLDGLYKLATDSAADAKLNLAQNNYNLTANGTIPFTANQGFAGDGSTGYLNTGFAPSTAAGNLALNSMFQALYTITTSRAASFAISIGTQNLAGTSAIYISSFANIGSTTWLITNNNPPASALDSAGTSCLAGICIGVRSASNAETVYYNGAPSADSDTVASVLLPDEPIFIGAENASGTAGSFSTDMLSYVAFGGNGSNGLTATQALLLAYRINADASALGINQF